MQNNPSTNESNPIAFPYIAYAFAVLLYAQLRKLVWWSISTSWNNTHHNNNHCVSKRLNYQQTAISFGLESVAIVSIIVLWFSPQCHTNQRLNRTSLVDSIRLLNSIYHHLDFIQILYIVITMNQKYWSRNKNWAIVTDRAYAEYTILCVSTLKTHHMNRT